MWREFFGFSGTILAVVNGLIAIVIATLPARRSVYKLRLGATALMLGALAVGATFYTKYHAYVQIERRQADRAETRKGIEALITEGRELLAQIRDAGADLPAAAADTWAQRVEIYLRDKLGAGAVPRFRKQGSELYGADTTIAAPRQAYWRAVRDRVVNLEAIGAAFAELPP